MCRISSVATLPAVQVLGPELEELSRMVEDMTSLYPQEGKQLRQPAAGDYCVACFEVGTARVHTCTCARMCTHTHTHTQTHTHTHTCTDTHTHTHTHTQRDTTHQPTCVFGDCSHGTCSSLLLLVVGDDNCCLHSSVAARLNTLNTQ